MMGLVASKKGRVHVLICGRTHIATLSRMQLAIGDSSRS